jgi:HEAT repeat protein
LQAERGAVRVVRFDVGPSRSRDAASDVTDLGVVPAAAAAEYLLDLAGTGSGSGARAITAAVLADSASVWRRLLAIARDSGTLSKSTRHEAAFWLAQFSAAKVDGRGESFIVSDDDDRDDPRSSAIFALSQLRNHEGIEPLLQIARTNHDARLRRKALFWLGESADPRAIALFGEIMGG